MKPTDKIASIYGVEHLMPKHADIPEEFHRQINPWYRTVEEWFFVGVNRNGFIPKDGIDRDKAIDHIRAIFRSMQPEHNHKMAACAYLCSLWFERYEEEARGGK